MGGSPHSLKTMGPNHSKIPFNIDIVLTKDTVDRCSNVLN